jgi:hypothetical protein
MDSVARDRVWRKFFADKATDTTAPETPTAQTPNNPNAAAGGAQHNANDHDLAPGVEIVSQEPIVIKYRNKDFAINDQGQWIAMASGKTPHESFQEFLSKQHDKSLGLAQSQGATAPATAAPAPATAAPNPEQVRQQKQAQATRAAQTQMAQNPAPVKPAVFRRRDNPRFNPGMSALDAVKGAGGATGTPPPGDDDNPNLVRGTNESVDLGQVLWDKMKRVE